MQLFNLRGAQPEKGAGIGGGSLDSLQLFRLMVEGKAGEVLLHGRRFGFYDS